MTFVAHSIVGATIAAAAAPKAFTSWKKGALVCSFVVLANFPDLKLPEWGHYRYYFSHSIFVNAFLIAALVSPFIYFPKLRERIGGYPVLIGGMCCWLSHLLLDSMYNHGKGIGVFWPVSQARLALPVPFLETLKGNDSYLTPHSLHVFLIEIASFGSVAVFSLLLILWRKRVNQPKHEEATYDDSSV